MRTSRICPMCGGDMRDNRGDGVLECSDCDFMIPEEDLEEVEDVSQSGPLIHDFDEEGE